MSLSLRVYDYYLGAGGTPLARRFSLPVEWSGFITLDRRFTIPAEWTGPPEINRFYGVPVEWLEARARLFKIPVEWTGLPAFFRKFTLPVEWGGEEGGTLLIVWDDLQLYNAILPVRWNVRNTGIRATLPITWNIVQLLQPLPIIWRVIPNLEPLFGVGTDSNIQQPDADVEETS